MSCNNCTAYRAFVWDPTNVVRVVGGDLTNAYFVQLPHLAGVIHCESFIELCLKSDNNTNTMIGVIGMYSVSGGNYTMLCNKYGINVDNVMNVRSNGCVLRITLL